jgi:hypothetical protein
LANGISNYKLGLVAILKYIAINASYTAAQTDSSITPSIAVRWGVDSPHIGELFAPPNFSSSKQWPHTLEI